MTPTNPPAPTDAVRLGGDGRKLTLVDVVAQSVGFMGPVFSIAFLVPLVMGIISATGKGAGIAAPLSIAIAAVGVLAVAWIVAQYAKRIQAAGALYDYVTDGLGQKIGAASGFLYYLGVMTLGAGLLVLIAGTVHDTLAGEFQFTGISVTAWAIILLVLIALIMYLGVALSTRFQLVLALLSVVTVLLFSIHVIIAVGSKNDVAAAFNPSSAPGGWSGIAFGIVYGVLLFTGFETAANLGEETEHPKRDIPRAVLASVLVVAAFYVICAYAQIAGFGFSLDAMGKAASAPLFALGAPTDAGGYGGLWIGRLLELVVVLDMLAVLTGISVASSRGIFAMSRDHRFPSVLGTVSRRGTPAERKRGRRRLLRDLDRADPPVPAPVPDPGLPALLRDVQLRVGVRRPRPRGDLPRALHRRGPRPARPRTLRRRRRRGRRRHRCHRGGRVRRDLPGAGADHLRLLRRRHRGRDRARARVRRPRPPDAAHVLRRAAHRRAGSRQALTARCVTDVRGLHARAARSPTAIGPVTSEASRGCQPAIASTLATKVRHRSAMSATSSMNMAGLKQIVV